MNSYHEKQQINQTLDNQNVEELTEVNQINETPHQQVQSYYAHELFDENQLTISRLGSHLVSVKQFDENVFIHIQPLNKSRYTKVELIYIQYILHITWAKKMNLENESLKSCQIPHFVFQQSEQDIQQLLGTVPDTQNPSLFKIRQPLLYTDLVVYSLHSGFSVRTVSQEEYDSMQDIDLLETFVTIVGDHLIGCKMYSKKVTNTLTNFESSLFVSHDCYHKEVGLVSDSKKEMQKLQCKQSLFEARFKHASMVANFRFHDLDKTESVKNELQIPVSLSIVPLFHQVQYNDNQIASVQKLYQYLALGLQPQTLTLFQNALKGQTPKQVFQQVTDNDCPFHFLQLLQQLELQFFNCLFSQFVTQTLPTQFTNVRLRQKWIRALSLLNIQTGNISDTEHIVIDELTKAKSHSVQNFINQLLDQDTTIAYELDIQERTKAIIIPKYEYTEVSEINDQSYLNSIFELVVTCFKKTPHWNFLCSLKALCYQLSQLSFICQNSTIIKGIQNSTKQNFFLCDGSRSGKSSVAQSIFYHSLFQNMLKLKDYPICLTMVQKQNIQDDPSQPLYKHYLAALDSQLLNFFSCSCSVMESQYNNRQYLMPLDQQLEYFIRFCFNLSIANQLDHLTITVLQRNIGVEVNVVIGRLLTYIKSYVPNSHDELDNLMSFIKKYFCYNDNQILIDFSDTKKDFVLFSQENNVFQLIKQAMISDKIQNIKVSQDCCYLSSQQQLLLCFDEFLSPFRSRIADSPVIMSMLPLLRLFFSIDQQSRTKILQKVRSDIISNSKLTYSEQTEFNNFTQNNKIVIPDNISTIKNLFLTRIWQFHKKSNLLDQFVKQILTANDDILRVYYEQIFNKNDIVNLLLSGAPNIGFISNQVKICQNLNYCSQKTDILNQQNNNFVTDYILDLFSFRGAVLLQIRQVQTVVYQYARHCNVLNTAMNKQPFEDLDKSLYSINQNAFVINSVLQSTFKSDNSELMVQCKESLKRHIQLKSCIAFIPQLDCKLLQINTDNSAINYTSLNQMMSSGKSSRSGKQNAKDNLIFSPITNPVLLQKLVRHPSFYTWQYLLGLDLMSSSMKELQSIFGNQNKVNKDLAQSSYSYIAEQALVLQDNVNIFQQIFSNLNPYILIVKKKIQDSAEKLLTLSGSNLINTIVQSSRYCNTNFVNRFQPLLFYSALCIELYDEYLEDQDLRNDVVLLLAKGIVKCKIFLQVQSQEKLLHDGFFDSIRTFHDTNQYQKRFSKFNDEIAILRVVETSNYNIMLQYKIQSVFNQSVLSLPIVRKDLINIHLNNVEQRDVFLVVYQSIYNYCKKHKNDQKQVSVCSFDEQFDLSEDLKIARDQIKRYYDTLETSFNVLSIDTLQEFLFVQMFKFIFSHPVNQLNLSVIQILRDLAIVTRILCVFKQDALNSLKIQELNDSISADEQQQLLLQGELNSFKKHTKIIHQQFLSLDECYFKIVQKLVKLPNDFCEIQNYSSSVIKVQQMVEDKYLANEKFFVLSDRVLSQEKDPVPQFAQKITVEQEIVKEINFLRLFQDLINYDDVEFAQLSLDQIQDQPPILEDATLTNSFGLADDLKRQHFFALIDKALNFSQCLPETKQKSFLFYVNSENSAVEKTNITHNQAWNGDGLIIGINLERLISLEKFKSPEKQSELKEFLETLTTLDRFGQKVKVLGVEMGRHNLVEMFRKFYFGKDLILNSIQFDIEISNEKASDDENIEDFWCAINNQISFVNITNLVINGAKNYTFFSEVLCLLDQQYPQSKFLLQDAAIQMSVIDYMLSKYDSSIKK